VIVLGAIALIIGIVLKIFWSSLRRLKGNRRCR
jgi:hypothetical protein